MNFDHTYHIVKKFERHKDTIARGYMSLNKPVSHHNYLTF